MSTKTKEELASEYCRYFLERLPPCDSIENIDKHFAVKNMISSFTAGYDAGQAAERKSVEICETYEKRSNYTWANGGYSEHDFINEGMIRMAKLLNSEIQSLMQQFNNEGEMKCRKS